MSDDKDNKFVLKEDETDDWENIIEEHANHIDQVIQMKNFGKRTQTNPTQSVEKRQKLIENFMTDDTLRMIFNCLEGDELGKITSVCKQWRNVIESSNTLWQKMYLRRWKLSNRDLVNELMSDILSRKSNEYDCSSPSTWRYRYAIRHCAETNFEQSNFRTSVTQAAHSGPVCSIRLFKDIIVTGGEDKMVKVWTLKSLIRNSKELKLKTENNLLPSSSSSSTINNLSQPSQPLIHRNLPLIVYQGHKDAVWGVDVSDNLIVSGSGDHSISLWPFDLEELNSPTNIRIQTTRDPLRKLKGHSAEVWAVQISDNKILSASVDGYVKLWDINTGATILTIVHVTAGSRSTTKPFKNDLCASVFDCNIQGNRILTAGGDTRMLEWDIRCPTTAIREYKGHEESIYSIAAENNILATGSGDQTVRIWDPSTGNCIQELPQTNQVWSCVTDGNTRLVTGGVGSRVELWSLKVGGEARQVGSFIGHVGSVFGMDMNDSVIVSGGADGDIRCMDFIDGQCDNLQQI